MKAIAHGIETNGQLFTLRAIGCDLGQGKVFADPMSAADVDVMFDRWPDGVICV